MHWIYKILIVTYIALSCNSPEKRIKIEIKPWRNLILYEPNQKEDKGLLSVDFKETPLSTALQMISEHYGKSILIEKSIAKTKVTIRKIDKDPLSIIESICLKLNLNKNEVSEKLILISSLTLFSYEPQAEKEQQELLQKP